MQVTLEKISAIESKVIITASGDETKEAFNHAYKEVASKAHFDGFRKGHVPRKHVLATLGDDITSKAVNSLCTKGIEEAYNLVSPRVIDTATPWVQLEGEFYEGAEFKFEVTLQTTTVLDDKDLSSVPVDVYQVNIDESDIDLVVEQLRMQQSRFEVDDNAVVADEHVANINFLGKKDGEPFEGGAATDFNLDISNARMIPGFIEQIKGHKAGDEFTINCKFPDDYHVSELAGADVTFDIKVNSVASRVLPEINDDFLKAYGFGGKSVEEFRTSLRQNLEQQAEGRSTNFNVQSALDAIIGEYGEFEVSKDLLKANAERAVKKQLGSIANEKLVASLAESFFPMVEHEAREQCVIRDLMAKKKIDISISDADVQAVVDSVANDYEEPEEFKKRAGSDKEIKSAMATIAGEMKLMSELLKLLKVNKITKNFADFRDIMIEKERAENEKQTRRMLEIAEKRRADSADSADSAEK